MTIYSRLYMSRNIDLIYYTKCTCTGDKIVKTPFKTKYYRIIRVGNLTCKSFVIRYTAKRWCKITYSFQFSTPSKPSASLDSSQQFVKRCKYREVYFACLMSCFTSASSSGLFTTVETTKVCYFSGKSKHAVLKGLGCVTEGSAT